MTTTAVKARPIVFSAPMVRAILDANKTQTRRPVKPQPIGEYEGLIVGATADEARRVGTHGWFDPDTGESQYIRCPYGQPGDLLWVRETWNVRGLAWGMKPRDAARIAAPDAWRYRATDPYEMMTDWRPSIHMPRAAARIWLELTDIRVERVQDITREDAIAEGFFGPDYCPSPALCVDPDRCSFDSEYHFINAWDALNAKRDGGAYSWDADPWVWVLTFRRTEAP